MVDYSNETDDYPVELITETDKAWLFGFNDGNELWVPKSVGEYNERSDEVTLPMWFAEREGLA